MLKSDFYYDLPKELIAQKPLYPRDSSKLLYYDRKDNKVRDMIFRDIGSLLKRAMFWLLPIPELFTQGCTLMTSSRENTKFYF